MFFIAIIHSIGLIYFIYFILYENTQVATDACRYTHIHIGNCVHRHTLQPHMYNHILTKT